MKFLLFILAIISTLMGYSQTVYTSPYTESFSNQQIESIERIISVSDKFVTITTKIDSSRTDIQQMRIVEVIRNFDKFGENITYSLTSLDGAYPSLLMVYLGDKINEIHIIQPLKDGSGNDRYRFLIN